MDEEIFMSIKGMDESDNIKPYMLCKILLDGDVRVMEML